MTWGVISARIPSVRPESWSTSLLVRRFKSLPQPESKDSMYSTKGGATCSKPYVRNRSRRLRRSSSIRLASAGSMSARLSGSNQLPFMIAQSTNKKSSGWDSNKKHYVAHDYEYLTQTYASPKQKAAWGVSPASRQNNSLKLTSYYTYYEALVNPSKKPS